MKTILKTITILTLLLSAYSIRSQVTVKAESITYSNGTSISECGTIDLATNPDTTISFWVRLKKPKNQVVGDGYLYVYTKSDSNSASENDIYQASIISSDWLNNHTQIYKSVTVTLQAQTFNLTGGVLFVRYVSSSNSEYNSCNHSVIKTQTPTFNISPSGVNIDCNDSSPITFSVTNVYNTSGTKTYKWEVGSNWLYNGNTAPNEITTTSNSIILTPNTFPTDNIRVATVLNGTQLPFSTSIVKLTSIQNREIIGDIEVCSSEVLSISNLKANETVVWTSSNTSIASINASNNQATVSANGSGIVTITATITNPCGQQVIKTKVVTVGTPAGYSDANIEPHPYSGNGGGFYLNNWTRMWMTNYPGGYNWHWTANYSMIQNASSAQPRIKPLSTGYMTVKVRRSNKCGYGAWVPKNFYITPKPGGGHHFEGF